MCVVFLSHIKKRGGKKSKRNMIKKKCHWWKCHEKSISNWTCLSNRQKKDYYFSDNSCHSQRKLILSTQTLTSFYFLLSLHNRWTICKKKKTRSKVNNKIKREKNPFFSLPSYLPFFAYACVCILQIHQSSISITSSTLDSQLNLIYIKLISNKKKRRKKSQCHTI